jgi:hypothetical protein
MHFAAGLIYRAQALGRKSTRYRAGCSVTNVRGERAFSLHASIRFRSRSLSRRQPFVLVPPEHSGGSDLPYCFPNHRAIRRAQDGAPRILGLVGEDKCNSRSLRDDKTKGRATARVDHHFSLPEAYELF